MKIYNNSKLTQDTLNPLWDIITAVNKVNIYTVGTIMIGAWYFS